MNDAHQRFQDAFNELFKLTLSDKNIFLEALLFHFTISGRGMWSDDKSTDAEKVEAFKWLNELLHRIWNIKHELNNDENNDGIQRLYENMRFYSEQSPLLRRHLVPTVLVAFETFKATQ